VDVAALATDSYVTSAYKWSGPHVAALIGRPEVLRGLHPDKLACSPGEVPYRFERGTLPLADLAGVRAAVDHLAALSPGDAGPDRRSRVLASMRAVEAYEQALFAELLAGLAGLTGVRQVAAPRHRTATAFFTVEGRTPRQVAEHLDRAGVNVWNGHNYAWELTGAYRIRDAGSAVRAGLVHYNDASDIARLLDGLGALT
jgi:selenocysteine lyase/cysteine desulfurase